MLTYGVTGTYSSCSLNSPNHNIIIYISPIHSKHILPTSQGYSIISIPRKSETNLTVPHPHLKD